MSRRLLLALSEAHAHGAAWMLLAALVLLALPAAAAFDALASWRRARAAERVLSQAAAACEAGCPPTPLADAVLRCPSCGLAWRSRRSALEPCPHCGATAHLQCACGLPLLNPLHEEEA